MYGLLLVGISGILSEIGTSVGKWQSSLKKESVYTMGFLNSLWGTLLLLGMAFFVPADLFAPGFPSRLVFVTASLPTFIPRVMLEIAQAYLTVKAVMIADRSTFGFLRILTIPLLLVADFLLSYPVTLVQIGGMSLIIMSLIFLFINHGIRKQGAWLVFLSAVNAAITISLYKYDITHFNSATAEQAIVSFILIVYFFVMAHYVAKENPLQLIRRPIFFMQSAVMGVASVIVTFAYLFGSASVITTGMRAFAILFAVVSGRLYFKEKALWIKIVSYIFIVGGLVLLAL